jgi:HSP20 family protein
MVTQKSTAPATNNKEAFWELHKLDQSGSSAFLLDAHEVDNVIELTAEVPGVQDSGIEVNLEGDILTISVEKRAQSEGKHIHFSERSYGYFKRSIQLPFAPDGDSVSADVQNGLLVIRFPRVETERMRRIALCAARPEPGEKGPAIGATWDEKSATKNALTLTDVVEAVPRESATQKTSQLTPGAWKDAEQT